MGVMGCPKNGGNCDGTVPNLFRITGFLRRNCKAVTLKSKKLQSIFFPAAETFPRLSSTAFSGCLQRGIFIAAVYSKRFLRAEKNKKRLIIA